MLPRLVLGEWRPVVHGMLAGSSGSLWRTAGKGDWAVKYLILLAFCHYDGEVRGRIASVVCCFGPINAVLGGPTREWGDRGIVRLLRGRMSAGFLLLLILRVGMVGKRNKELKGGVIFCETAKCRVEWGMLILIARLQRADRAVYFRVGVSFAQPYEDPVSNCQATSARVLLHFPSLELLLYDLADEDPRTTHLGYSTVPIMLTCMPPAHSSESLRSLTPTSLPLLQQRPHNLPHPSFIRQSAGR
jgi:hypothetical protein